MKILSEEEFNRLSEQSLKVPIYITVSSDLMSPLRAYYALKEKYSKGFLLESREHVQDIGRYSFVGFDPKITLEVRKKKTILKKGDKEQVLKEPFEAVLRKLLSENKIIENPDLPPLAGGAVGFMGYDSIQLFEKVSARHKDREELPELYFGFYQTIIVFDHFYQMMTLLYIPDEKNAFKKGIEHLKQVLSHVMTYSQKFSINFDRKPAKPLSFDTDCSDEEYQKIVSACQEHILNGDIYQITPSRTFFQKFTCDPFDIYRVLRILNPSPYLFFLDNEEYTLAGSSPERFASLKEGIIETMPIAGTIARGIGALDDVNEKSMLSDESRIALHTMLIDLARSSCGEIAKPGSVQVHDRLAIQRLSHVMHITSRVTAEIQSKYDALDVLKTFLPAQNHVGAPTLRAMEIIDQLEKSRRGVFGGCICYIDNLGHLDSCVATRMVYMKEGLARVRVGTSVVHDSVPMKKASESFNQAKRLLEGIQRAERGELC